ncbi:wax ester/triacylglycerol synthase domain-containing protein [Glaciecola petra]|uniref:diacylglycerol O-acyltransferase n=1 Tax=Glaciecola petra TaxID=3075602 RepID=A0ABU2ZRP2_9ALTE|nr:wax ester/triacylglycerol synthase domain-containing protein [Aestuariibacter sp. P117]MDT0594112.1 wax ester/triacylglycerol synthase family O-acyltransferase [Aestuariibacter sp. P117]
MSKKISFLDRMFWITESKANPKHVAAMQLLEIPENAPTDYVDQLYAELQSFDSAVTPFNCKVSQFLGYPIKLTPTKQINMQYHVQLHIVDDITNKVKLHKFVAKLHESWLDRDKPLWQYHLIKDKQSKVFAIYVKVHHMCGDGASLIRIFQKGYSENINSSDFVPVWASKSASRTKPKVNIFKRILTGLWGFIVAIKDLLWIIFRLMLKLLWINRVYMPIPFTGTKTILTGQVKIGRVVSSMDIDFTRVTKLAKRLRASANEILLCAFDIGVHRFLEEHGQGFDKALYTNMPVNLRKPGETTAGNQIAIVPVKLAFDEHDPYLRLRQIIENHRIVKSVARESHPAAFSYYTLLIQSFSTLFEVLHISDWFRPIGNILVSNMPGPANTLYFKDAKLLSNYPISTITPGGGVNITVVTYNGIAQIGLVSCDSKIDSLDNMVKYFHAAFNMLEKCVDDDSLSIKDIVIR